MIDFKKRREEIQQKLGWCSLPDRCYDSIDAIRVDHQGIGRLLLVHWIVERRNSIDNRPCFRLLDGVTGYESWYVDDLLKRLDPSSGLEFNFAACAGGGNWDGLYLRSADVYKILSNLKGV